MLKLKFDPRLDFQFDAISSVVDLFDGQAKKSFAYTFQIIPNLLDLPREKFFESKKIPEFHLVIMYNNNAQNIFFVCLLTFLIMEIYLHISFLLK